MFPFVAALLALASLHWMSHLDAIDFHNSPAVRCLDLLRARPDLCVAGIRRCQLRCVGISEADREQSLRSLALWLPELIQCVCFKGPNVIDGMSEEQVRGWVDAYCKKSPGQNLDAAVRALDMNVPGFDFHALRGFDPTRYTVHVNGPWCITFEFNGGETEQVDWEQYH